MSSMQIDLYDALTGANIPSDKAKAVVESLQEHIDMQVSRANEAVLAKLDGVQGTLVAKIDALVSGRIDPIEKANAANLNALVSGRIDPVEKAIGLLVSDKQLRVQRTRWVVGTILTMTGLISAGAGTLHALHII